MTFPDVLTRDTDGYIHLTGHRIGLQDVVYFYNEGESPEMLLDRFPTLTLADIYSVLAFYWKNHSEVDAYVADCEATVAKQRAASREGLSVAEMRRRLASRGEAESA